MRTRQPPPRQLLTATRRPQELHGTSTGEAIVAAAARSPTACLLVLYCTLIGLLLIALAGFHAYLISINQTTYESVRGTYSGGLSNPFDLGVRYNCLEAFCSTCVRLQARGASAAQLLRRATRCAGSTLRRPRALAAGVGGLAGAGPTGR